MTSLLSMNSTCHVSASDLRNPSVGTGIELANVHERLDATPRACFANCSARPFLPSRSERDEVRPVAFLDRDGVINVDRGYTYRIEDLVFTPTAIEGIKVFNDAGYRVFVVTNQSGVARGYYTLEDVERFHEAMREQLRAHNAHIDCFYYCPFHPETSIAEYATDHEDRKPNPGMLLRAFREWPTDIAASVMIGDKESDLQAAARAGVTGLLVEPNVCDLASAVRTFLARRCEPARKPARPAER